MLHSGLNCCVGSAHAAFDYADRESLRSRAPGAFVIATIGPMPIARGVGHHSHYQVNKRSPDEAVAELAGRQHGVVTRRQLEAIGLATGGINLRLANGRLHIVHRAVYAVGHVALTRKGRWIAAVLAGGPHAALSHAAAGALLGIRASDALVVDVTAPSQRQARPGIRFHRSPLPLDEVATKDGIAVTTVARTLFDLAAVVSLSDLRRTVNEAEIQRLWDSISLADLLERHPRRPGAAAIRAVIETPGTGITRSDLEELVLALIDRSGLPRPALNVTLHVGARFIEVDCVWREQGVIIELDGYETHGTRAAYESDRARDRMLTAAGWHVMRLTWRQLHEEAEAVVRDVRALLTRRARERQVQEPREVRQGPAGTRVR